MSLESKTKATKEKRTGGGAPDEKGWGEDNVGGFWIATIAGYFIIFFIFLLLSLFAFWPTKTDGTSPTFVEVIYLGSPIKISAEVQLLILVALAGAIGSLVHTIRSFAWYAGQRKLVWSWITRYVLQPFVGSALGLIFYFVIRGGFFSTNAGVNETLPFSFIAVAGLVGMFAEPAVLKLKQVAETLFAKPEPGKEASPQKSNSDEDDEDRKKN